ncbi:MAG: tRNA pseudouridine(55) synthase TruB, partial [Chloroflexi bacterium]|nr:tRNA pseudouridine(55) synthase TruB [Chloroflexota bacterium]
MDGYLNIWKPRGPTSFEVVRRLRRALRLRSGQAGAGPRVGHGGTLDPLAEGVLPILVGQATRLSALLEGCGKEYRARVLLGVRTDTFDVQGQVLSATDPSRVTLEEVEATLPAFTGRILQRPPAFSALKRGGQPLYKLARRGETVETE